MKRPLKLPSFHLSLPHPALLDSLRQDGAGLLECLQQTEHEHATLHSTARRRRRRPGSAP